MFSLFAQPSGRDFLYCQSPCRAFLQYRQFRMNLLTGARESVTWREWLTELAQYRLDAYLPKPKVIHFFYELGPLMEGIGNDEPDTKPLGIEIDYLKASQVDLSWLARKGRVAPRLQFLQVPTFSDYKNDFQIIQEHLQKGNCYQVNLTRQFVLAWQESYCHWDFIAALWKRPTHVAAYAHATWSDALETLYLSNSPECLWQRRITADGMLNVYSMPIKGTLPLKSSQERQRVWEQMCASEKETGELNMITDLVRNDLCRIEKPWAKVVAKRLPLEVPGLLHQYALLSTEVTQRVDWGKLMRCLFPGGSITGAPKKRVMEIIRTVEPDPRGFYCGSTLLAFRGQLAASINIRSATIDMNAQELIYGAGGGVTVKSQVANEFEEMMRKTESFLSSYVGK